MIVGTPSWRSRAPSAMPPWPPPMITHLGLGLVAELLGLALAALEPRLPLGVGAVLDALGPLARPGLLVALELVERGEQRPRLAVLQAQVSVAAADLGLERRARPRSRPRPRRAPRSCASRAGFACARACARACPGRPSGPSTVLMFQVNATRSRQKLSSRNSSLAAAASPAVSASSKLDSHWSTSVAGEGRWSAWSPPSRRRITRQRGTRPAVLSTCGRRRGDQIDHRSSPRRRWRPTPQTLTTRRSGTRTSRQVSWETPPPARGGIAGRLRGALPRAGGSRTPTRSRRTSPGARFVMAYLRGPVPHGDHLHVGGQPGARLHRR